MYSLDRTKRSEALRKMIERLLQMRELAQDMLLERERKNRCAVLGCNAYVYQMVEGGWRACSRCLVYGKRG